MRHQSHLSLGVPPSTGLGSGDQCNGSILLGHVQLDKLEVLSSLELLVGEQGVELVLGLDGEGLGADLLAVEDINETLVLPVVDVVVLGLHAVDESLNGVTLVADDEAIVELVSSFNKGGDAVHRKKNSHCDWEIVSDHGAHFLGTELEGTVTNEEDCSPALAVCGITGTEGSALASTNGPADGSPEDLAESSHTSREASSPDTKVGSSSLSNDDVVLLKELANAGPEPLLGDGGGLVVVLLNLVDDVGTGDGAKGLGIDLSVDLSENTTHGDAGVGGVSDNAVIRVKVDAVELRGSVGETSSVEVGLEATDGQHKVGRLNDVADLRRIGTLTGVDTTIVGVVLVDGGLAHGSHEDGQVGLLQEGVDLGEDTVADGTGIDEDDGLLGLRKSLDDEVDNVVLALGLVGHVGQVDGSVETSTLDLGLHHVGGEHDVDRAGLDPALTQGVVDLLGDLGGVVQLGNVARDHGAHVGKDVEVAVAQSVVQQHAIALRERRRAADNVDEGDVLRVGTGNTVDGGKLTNTKGGDESTNLVYSGVAIGGVSYWRGRRRKLAIISYPLACKWEVYKWVFGVPHEES